MTTQPQPTTSPSGVIVRLVFFPLKVNLYFFIVSKKRLNQWVLKQQNHSYDLHQLGHHLGLLHDHGHYHHNNYSVLLVLLVC